VNAAFEEDVLAIGEHPGLHEFGTGVAGPLVLYDKPEDPGGLGELQLVDFGMEAGERRRRRRARGSTRRRPRTEMFLE